MFNKSLNISSTSYVYMQVCLWRSSYSLPESGAQVLILIEALPNWTETGFKSWGWDLCSKYIIRCCFISDILLEQYIFYQSFSDMKTFICLLIVFLVHASEGNRRRSRSENDLDAEIDVAGIKVILLLNIVIYLEKYVKKLL